MFFSTSRADQGLSAKNIFNQGLDSPSTLTYCNGALWAYSVGTGMVTKLEATTGKILKSLGVSIIIKKKVADFEVVSLACFNDQLLLGGIIFNSEKIRITNALYSYSPKQGFIAKNIPESDTHLRDINCGKKKCTVIQGEVHISEDLDNWSRLKVPASSKITNKKSRPDINPFADWQDKFVLGSGRYIRGSFAGADQLFLLDSLRASIVSVNGVQKYLDGAGALNKWGKWGGWEGQLMFPKAISYIKKYDVLAVSDVALKFVFIYTKQGDYIGKLGSDADNVPYRYPLDLEVHADTIFIADFQNNAVIATQITSVNKQFEIDREDIDALLHQNLFKRSDIREDLVKTRCLNCHDGLEKYSLRKFIKHPQLYNHPRDAEVSGEIDLPLKKKKMNCNTCHDQHHESIEGISFDPKGVRRKVAPIRYNLRKEYSKLCLTCHTDKAQNFNNHFDLNMDFKKSKSTKEKGLRVVSCSQCHSMHAAKEKLNKMRDPKLCLNCHKDHYKPKSHSFGVVKDKLVNCFSCHNIHGGKKEFSFARMGKNGKENACSNCHQDLVAKIGSNKHLSVKKKKKPVMGKYDWPKNEGICLDCHRPHKKGISIEKTCASCHKKKIQIHQPLNPVANTYRAEGIRLNGTKVVCTTCHQHHGLSSEKKFLKPKESLLIFCSSCHGEKTLKLFDHYHREIKRAGK